MKDDSADLAVIQVLLKRLNEKRLPALLALKARVDRGEKLPDRDITHMKDALADASQIGRLVQRHPEYAPLVTRVTGLYQEIAAKALENEQKS